MTIDFDSKILLYFPPRRGRTENKVLWISEITQYFQKHFTDYDRGTWALQKICEAIEGCCTTQSSFSRWTMGCIEKVKTSNISGTIQPIFLILSPWVWKNNGLLNNNHCDNLDIIDQGHSKGNVSQFCLYLGYAWTNFNKIVVNQFIECFNSDQFYYANYVFVNIYAFIQLNIV